MMIIRKLRLQEGWSQEQLAELSGLSVRTIQRMERGQKTGLESLKSVAAVFEVNLTTLTEASAMETSKDITLDEQKAIEYVRDIKAFYTHLISYVTTIAFLFLLNLSAPSGGWWVVWPALGWGIGVLAHGVNVFEVFNVFSPEWEKKQIEKKLGKKL